MSLVIDIRRLGQRDPTGGFSAGTSPDDVRLNEFLQRYAKQNEKRQTTATWVAVVGGAIVGFVTITPSSVCSSTLAGLVKGLSGHPASVLMLARMATDARFQGKGIGDRLMRDVVFARAIDLAAGFGCVGVYVDAKERALTFYSRYGFVQLSEPQTPNSTPMFLPLATLRSAIGPITTVIAPTAAVAAFTPNLTEPVSTTAVPGSLDKGKGPRP
jgi:predicted N-acetyltransferase YhbS